MRIAPTMAPDAAMALGIASTALPFARTAEDEAERWLRVLRLHGQAGVALQALGVGEQRLVEQAPSDSASPALGEDAVERVGEEAARIACDRGGAGVETTDLLLAVMEVYGDDFDRALQAHGTDCKELALRLEVQAGEA
jgi:hypothetical protein